MKNFLLYGLATGFNRLGTFVVVPLLSLVLSVDDFGKFTLYAIIIQILTPVVSFNISSIIARESAENWRATLTFVNVFNKISLAIILLSLITIFIERYVFFEILIYSLFEALFLVNTTLVRFKNTTENFFYISFAKVILLLILLGGVWFFNKSLLGNIHNLILIFSFSNIVVAIPYVKATFLKNAHLFNSLKYICKKKYILYFALGLMPHIIAQWITSGSDRFIVKFFCGNISLGIYSFIYSIAAAFMLINSALALGMPQLCVSNYKNYTSYSFYKKYLMVISIFWAFFVMAVVICSPIFPARYNFNSSLPEFIFISVGMYYLSFYYYYSSFIFYERRSKELSFITVKVAVINIVITIILTATVGILGTAISTAISYFVYSFYTYRAVLKDQYVKGLFFPLIISLFIALLAFLINKFFL
ncbi:lipopolysaccharide biosynthesis protein [Mixta tenebrionis]|uniref:Oligosaccharide flippase family protein n=1 Tax=Mixta tenebrionis TaxID=2562439 RepID=A0A506VCI6_9GAMM|nr:polysaccharide biosynthesis C-terminal domain-containing protein [Mixta tenebrionis]TPW42703.1 oligosaccharide flippase family protein [Mixta tenebrionis]